MSSLDLSIDFEMTVSNYIYFAYFLYVIMINIFFDI